MEEEKGESRPCRVPYSAYHQFLVVPILFRTTLANHWTNNNYRHVNTHCGYYSKILPLIENRNIPTHSLFSLGELCHPT